MKESHGLDIPNKLPPFSTFCYKGPSHPFQPPPVAPLRLTSLVCIPGIQYALLHVHEMRTEESAVPVNSINTPKSLKSLVLIIVLISTLPHTSVTTSYSHLLFVTFCKYYLTGGLAGCLLACLSDETLSLSRQQRRTQDPPLSL